MTTTIIGLGNPGKKFEKTRHNVGFMAVDEFARKNNFPDFELNKKPNALISQKDGIILVKPQTFMNESGKSVKNCVKSDLTQFLVVIHDDIDLPVGKIKIIKERGSAGHKGVESIIKNVGNENLIRIRLGIKPEQYRRPVHGTKNFVLKKFSKDEQRLISEAISKTAGAIDFLIKNGLEKAMNKYNK